MENQATYNTKNRVPGMNEVKLIQAIYCSKKRVGHGTEISPVAISVEIFDTEGVLLAENNPLVKYTDEDLISFTDWYYKYSNKNDQMSPLDRINDWKKHIISAHQG
jgi:hypothetical protein